jgi:hypothetical protein
VRLVRVMERIGTVSVLAVRTAIATIVVIEARSSLESVGRNEGEVRARAAVD